LLGIGSAPRGDQVLVVISKPIWKSFDGS